MKAQRLAIAGLLLATLSLTPSWGGTGIAGLRVLGMMPFSLHTPYDYTDSNNQFNLFVDGALHRGFMLTAEDNERFHIAVYDLRRLRRVATIAWPLPAFNSYVGDVDQATHRLFIASITGPPLGTVGVSCGQGTTFVIVDTLHLTTSQATMPCVAGAPFAVEGLSYYAPAKKLYAVGAPVTEKDIIEDSNVVPKVHTYFAQIDPATFHVDWTADATTVCDWHVTAGGAVVARHGDDLVSFCYQGGDNYNFGGTRGVALVMPISTVGGATPPSFQTSYTYTDNVKPLVDPVSGRLLLQSETPPYGPAVWGYDPFAQRFFGVAPAGQVYGPDDDQFSGYDPASGRLYIVNPQGTAVIDTRGDVMPGGITLPVLAHMQHGEPGGEAGYAHGIMSDSTLRRLFVAYPKRGGFIVVQDDLPPYRTPPTADPDQGTADISETAGTTTSAFSGSGDAFGLHVVNEGGIPGTIDNWDQTCYSGSPVTGADGRCLADRSFTAGNREFYVSQSGVSVGSDSGVTAFGAVLHFPVTDTADNTDFKSVATCFTDRYPSQFPRTLTDAVSSVCRDQSVLQGFAAGTQQPNGKDAPFPGAACVDETGGVRDDASAARIQLLASPVSVDTPLPFGTTSAHCDDQTFEGRAAADTAVAALPDPSAPAGQPDLSTAVLSVAHASSSVRTQRGPQGTVTTVTARVSGIRIAGTFFIGQVFAQSVTTAHGRSGTTSVSFKRVISDVQGPGIDCVSTCAPEAVIDAFNRAFNSQGRLRVPSPYDLASPHGYQSLLIKDPVLRASDEAILNDDSDTFDGLDLIIDNDGFNANTFGPNARSRLLVELAGVHAESRYGIFPTVAVGGGTQVPGVTGALLGPGTLSPPAALRGIGQPGIPSAGRPSGLVQAVTSLWGFVVNHPAQAALLFVFLGLLTSPIYLGLRTHALERSLRR